MRKADRLSRKPDWKVGIEKDNDNQVFIKDFWLYSLHEIVIEEPKVNILEIIKKIRGKNEEIVRVVEEIKKAEEKWQLKGDLVLNKRKMYVLKNEELRVEIFWLHYDVLVAEHGEK